MARRIPAPASRRAFVSQVQETQSARAWRTLLVEHLTFDGFFNNATGFEPFGYQCRLACGEQSGRTHLQWISSGTDCRSLLVNIPTGCGKTAAVVLAWLWNRVVLERADWPRRLVYCLPMRVLVEQTRDNVRTWLHALDRARVRSAGREDGNLAWLAKNSPVVLMGGEDADPVQEQWDLWPEKPAVIIGTQDMLLSRVLNRGYAASRARWPMDFGLLNTDCLWVLDEVQLMGPGLATTAQLEAFRSLFGSKDGHGCRSIWMSATLQRDWLKTVDFRDCVESLLSRELTDDDHKNPEFEKRWKARKPLEKAHATMGDASALALNVLKAHKPGTRTLVVLNTVRRACEIFEELRPASDSDEVRSKRRRRTRTRLREPADTKSADAPTLALLHSRFRAGDRQNAIKRALEDPPPQGTIVVTTQVIEAGVDVSATTLFSELAPWASLVQRFGRCNRRGEVNESAAVWWVDFPEKDAEPDKAALPYELGDLKESAERLQSLRDVGLMSLLDIKLRFDHSHVIRRRDLIDLFDTTPDLAGSDIDIDRFVRDVEETDVRVFWRDWEQASGGEPPPDDEPAPTREELCPASVGEFRDFAMDDERKGKLWRWDFLNGEWERVDLRKIVPGQVFLVHADAGGYTHERGWHPGGVRRVEPVVARAAPSGNAADATDADDAARIGVWQTIAEHTDEVCRELDVILHGLSGDHAQSNALCFAARWHDRGKAHEVFQNAVDDGQVQVRKAGMMKRRERPKPWRGCRFVAKAPDRQKDHTGTIVDPGFWGRYERKQFRHELASALVVLDPRNMQIPSDLRNLIAYLVAAHHGKVRLSLRSLPDEHKPRDTDGHSQPSKRFARGVWDGDRLPDTDLGGGVLAPAATLSLEPMELGLCEHEPFTGQPSWGERMIWLRDSQGPFRLGYLETILRAADMRASVAAEQRAACGDKRGTEDV